MESTRPIRALVRGLDALTVLNSCDGATVSEVAQDILLPRTTVYRILETFCDSGFVVRDTADDRYRLTAQVRGLRSGFHDESWVRTVAQTQIDDLCGEIIWPVAIATLSGKHMMMRATTDHDTPLATERLCAGSRLPLLTSASGRAYLGFCPAAERDSVLDTLALSKKEDDKLARSPRADLAHLWAEIKTLGYASATRTGRRVDEVSIAVPALADDRVLATVSVRFSSFALPMKAGVERFLPKLRDCAAKISTLIAQQRAAVRTNGAPTVAV